MNPSTLHSPELYTDIQGLESLRIKAKNHSADAASEVAKQFEALYLQSMLKTMRSAKLDEGLFDSDSSDFYLDMFDKQIALSIAHGRGMGLADVLTDQLSRYTDTSSNNRSSTAKTSEFNTVNFRMQPVVISPVNPISDVKFTLNSPVEFKDSNNQHGSELKVLQYRTTQELGEYK